ncbi:MAG: cell wall hydrolase [Lachnospiraceae bacterium]|nr:cell wall hydrolase [Lachnospiraceae bacterium]
MMKRIVGAVTVMTVTFSALGMGYPQENDPRIGELTKVLDTTQATEMLVERNGVNQKEATAVQMLGELSIRVIADEQAQLHDASMPLVANVVESTKRKTTLTDEEILLMQKVVSAESRGESPEAQYTVACVILNRMESPIFPDTLEGVVRQSGQFTCVGNGIINNVPITESVEQAVAKALDNNTVDEDVLWFRSSHYHTFHNQAFKIGDLYFSAA